MPPEKIDSLADDVKPLVLELLRQNSGLTVRVNELLAQNKALLARIAELEAKHGKPPKTCIWSCRAVVCRRMAQSGSRADRTTFCASRFFRRCSGGCSWRCWSRRMTPVACSFSAITSGSRIVRHSTPTLRLCATSTGSSSFGRPYRLLGVSRPVHRDCGRAVG
jgi:hypothetical protein